MITTGKNRSLAHGLIKEKMENIWFISKKLQYPEMTTSPDFLLEVMSAISAIAQSALYGCSAYDKELVLNKIQKGYVHFICRKTPETNAVILAAVLGLNAIKEQYPQCFKQGD